eukprot:5551971-Alexandrium_andersonii.AAC.1
MYQLLRSTPACRPVGGPWPQPPQELPGGSGPLDTACRGSSLRQHLAVPDGGQRVVGSPRPAGSPLPRLPAHGSSAHPRGWARLCDEGERAHVSCLALKLTMFRGLFGDANRSPKRGHLRAVPPRVRARGSVLCPVLAPGESGARGCQSGWGAGGGAGAGGRLSRLQRFSGGGCAGKAATLLTLTWVDMRHPARAWLAPGPMGGPLR